DETATGRRADHASVIQHGRWRIRRHPQILQLKHHTHRRSYKTTAKSLHNAIYHGIVSLPHPLHLYAMQSNAKRVGMSFQQREDGPNFSSIQKWRYNSGPPTLPHVITHKAVRALRGPRVQATHHTRASSRQLQTSRLDH